MYTPLLKAMYIRVLGFKNIIPHRINLIQTHNGK